MGIDCSFDIIIIGEHIAIEHDSVDSQTKGLVSQKCLAYLRSASQARFSQAHAFTVILVV